MCSYYVKMMDRKTLSSLIWIDTRDMVSDGLTKGAVSREGIHEIMDGCVRIREQFHQWSSKAVMQHAVEDVTYAMKHWFVRVQEGPSFALSRARRRCRTESKMSIPAGFIPLEAVVVPRAAGGMAMTCPSQSDLYLCEGKAYRENTVRPVVSMPRGHWKTPKNMHRIKPSSRNLMRASRCRTSPLMTSSRPCGTVHHRITQYFNGQQDR